MKFDSTALNVNPLFALNGYMPEFGGECFFAGNAEEYIFQFLTDRDAIQAALPEPMFKAGEKPIATVGFTWLDNSAELEGGEYGISVLFVNARFDGEKDHIEGNFALMMPETSNYAVAHGREMSGDAKFLVHMPRPYSVGYNGHTRCETRAWNYEKGAAEWKTIYGVDFEPMKECDKATMEQIEKTINAGNQMCWKVVSSVDGGIEFTHAYYYNFTRKMKQCWQGKSGELYLGNIQNKSLLLERYVINAMKKIPVREVIGTLHWIGTLEAIYASNTGGRIK